jgi:predicted dehydrogenase
MSDNNINPDSGKDKKDKIGRREVLKGLATVPVLGAFAYGVYKKKQYDRFLKNNIADEVGMSYDAPEATKPSDIKGKPIRVGLIGYGNRGKHLARGLGFAHPSFIENWKRSASKNSKDKRYEEYLQQEDLGVVVTAVCDIFSSYEKMAVEAGANIYREGNGGRMGADPKVYKTYHELCAALDVDAVIIGTPDHHHGPITIEAAKNGKHVYCEKPLTWTVEETYEVRNVVKESGIVFQLGHQGRQTDSYQKAQEAIDKGVLGPISLIEVTTNRNDPNGAWVYDIHKDANPNTIDWDQFLGPAPWHEFSLERFFRWRCWWDYSTGLSGDLLTHEYDAINQIMSIGIPESAMSTGGIYYYKDGRTVPDVLHTVFEFPKKDLSLLYSATLSSNKSRGKVIMGHDAWMELGQSLTVNADPRSTKYKQKINDGLIDPSLPLYSYVPGRKNVDAVTSATERYFAGRGLLYTYRGGKRVDTTHLHIKEWIDAIREGTQPSCNIDQGFEEAITAHMGTLSYKHNKKVFWDAENEKIIV